MTGTVVLGPCFATWGYSGGWRVWRERILRRHAMHACTGGHSDRSRCTCKCGAMSTPVTLGRLPSGPVLGGQPYTVGGPFLTLGAPDTTPAQLTLDDDPRPYTDAVHEAFDQCTKLGLDVNPDGEYDAADLIRYAYAQGYLACEKRLASPNMADQIDAAIRTPEAVVEKLPGESVNRQVIRAIQHTVAYGVKSEPH